MTRPLAIGAPFSIEMAQIDDADSLPASLIALSAATQVAYDLALDTGRTEIATELRVLGGQVAALIARAMRKEVRGS